MRRKEEECGELMGGLRSWVLPCKMKIVNWERTQDVDDARARGVRRKER